MDMFADTFQEILQRFDHLAKNEINLMVKRHARLLAVQCALRTQPFSVGEKGKGSAAQKQGQDRVKREVGRTFVTSDRLRQILDHIKSPRWRKTFERAITAQNVDMIMMVMEKTGMIKGWSSMHTIVTKANIRDVHWANRDHKTGRTFKTPYGFNVPVNNKIVDTYAKQQMQRVGMTKAGWADAARKLNIVKGDGARGIPAWAKSKKHKAMGDVTYREREGELSVFLTNRIPWASRALPVGEQYQAQEWTMKQFIKALEKQFKAAAKNQAIIQAEED